MRYKVCGNKYDSGTAKTQQWKAGPNQCPAGWVCGTLLTEAEIIKYYLKSSDENSACQFRQMLMFCTMSMPKTLEAEHNIRTWFCSHQLCSFALSGEMVPLPAHELTVILTPELTVVSPSLRLTIVSHYGVNEILVNHALVCIYRILKISIHCTYIDKLEEVMLVVFFKDN